MEIMVRKDQHHLLALSIHPIMTTTTITSTTNNNNNNNGTTRMSMATPISIPNPSSCCGTIILLDMNKNQVRAILDGAHSKNDIVQCICPLPDGGILSAGGKMDATIQLWEPIPNEEEEENKNNHSPVIITNAKKLQEPGYVFDLKVLPDKTNSTSNVYAVAGARYNVIKIVI